MKVRIDSQRDRNGQQEIPVHIPLTAALFSGQKYFRVKLARGEKDGTN